MQEKHHIEDHFFSNLRYLVNQTGLKDYEIAMRLGIHRGTFARYFSEGRIPGKSIVTRMARYFGVNPDELLYGNLLPYKREETADIYCAEETGQEKITDADEYKLREIIADRLSAVMKDKQLRQSDLADISGVAQSAISRYLNMNGLPRLVEMYKLTSALDISMDWLVGKKRDTLTTKINNTNPETEISNLKIKIGIVTEMLRGALKQIESN